MFGKLFFVMCALALAIAESAPQQSANKTQNSETQNTEQDVAVQLKDPAYSSAYGYEAPTGYEGHVVATDEAGTVGHVLPGHLSFLTSLLPMPTVIFSVLKKVAHVALASTAAVVIGGCITFLFCTLTPFCSESLGQYGHIQEEVRSFVTPQRMASVTEFVKNAVEKYQKMQV